MLIQPGKGFQFGSLRPAPAMSNAERQRRFQDAHPGYDRRRKARRRGMLKRAVAQIRRAEEAMAAEATAVQAAPVEPTALPAPAVARLALPAPVVDPVMAELDAMSAALALSRARARAHAHAALPVRPVPAAA